MYTYTYTYNSINHINIYIQYIYGEHGFSILFHHSIVFFPKCVPICFSWCFTGEASAVGPCHLQVLQPESVIHAIHGFVAED